MDLRDKIEIHLNQIKHLKGIWNVILLQRDGNPIQTEGIWFSKDEIFTFSAIASALYNLGLQLHPDDMKYILLETRHTKTLFSPLNNPIHQALNRILESQGISDHRHEYFIIITAQPNINLRGIFLQTQECLKKIKTTLITSGESFKPYLNQVDLKEDDNLKSADSSLVPNISERISIELIKNLNSISVAIPDLKFAGIVAEGGHIISKLLKHSKKTEAELDGTLSISYSLFQRAKQYGSLLKKRDVESILIDCQDRFQFIDSMEKSILTVEIGKVRQKLGLIRLIIPQFKNKIHSLIQELF